MEKVVAVAGPAAATVVVLFLHPFYVGAWGMCPDCPPIVTLLYTAYRCFYLIVLKCLVFVQLYGKTIVEIKAES